MPTILVSLPQMPKPDADHKAVVAWARRLMIALPIALDQLQHAAEVTVAPGASPFPIYTITNRVTDHAYDADITDIDELADVMGTIIFEISTGVGFGTYTISNTSTDRSFDALATSLDELADVIGTIADDITNANNTSHYTVFNAVADRAYDADATTEDELADVLATFIADCQSRGILG